MPHQLCPCHTYILSDYILPIGHAKSTPDHALANVAHTKFETDPPPLYGSIAFSRNVGIVRRLSFEATYLQREVLKKSHSHRQIFELTLVLVRTNQWPDKRQHKYKTNKSYV